ncbi:MAG TPA: hypothetical protein VFZ03_05125 [Dongiaceae bacterium]
MALKEHSILPSWPGEDPAIQAMDHWATALRVGPVVTSKQDGLVLFRRHQVAFAAGHGLVQDLAHGVEAGAALRRRAFAAEHLLAAGRAGARGRLDVVIADSVADADDHCANDNAINSQKKIAADRALFKPSCELFSGS